MKRFSKILSIFLVLTLVLSLAGCGSKPAIDEVVSEDGLFKKGTYKASAPGMGGDVEVEVSLSDSAIESIKILSHNETVGISDVALENIPANIIAAQGLGVDVVSGATLTSNAIIEAVTDCLRQAGGDIDALMAKGLDNSPSEDEVLDTDVVVVGGGIAGLSAAIAAAEEGAQVILLEKMGNVGGASLVCGGEILAAGTEMQKAQGIEDSSEDLKNYWLEVGNGKINEEIISFIADNAGKTVDWLKERGTKFANVTFSYNDPNQDPMRNHSTESVSGQEFVFPLLSTAQDLGVEVRFETPAIELINDGGSIKGVIAENKGSKITINAKSVILATGGYANNAELMKEYAPNIGASGTFLGEAHQGDGLLMARDAGAEILAGGGAIANPMDLGPTAYADAGGIFLNITPEGKRYANENEYWFTRTAKLYHEEGFNYYYGITDSKTKNDGFDAAIEAGTTIKADSLEELAGLLNIDENVFVKTIDRYNEMCRAQVDSDFGKPALGKVGSRVDNVIETSLLNSIEEGPFYAIKFETLSVTGTFGGPKVNLKGEVISTSGDIIPGLYAAGEVANGELFYQQYPCSGSSIQINATMGIQAGKAAASK